MSEIIDKLRFLEDTKALFKTRLGAGDEVPFRDYLDLLPKAKTVTRPADWLPMPEMAIGTQKAAILVGIFDTDSEYVALSAQGAYTVAWGDGIVENFDDGAVATHKYSYASLQPSTACVEGYRQALISVTPQAGDNLRRVTLNETTPKASRESNYLEAKISGPSISSFAISSGLRRLTFIGTNSIGDFSYLFSSCLSLEVVSELDTSLGISFAGMFNCCRSLVSIPELNVSLGTNFSNMFNGCSSIETIPALNAGLGTDFSGMFSGCKSLTSVTGLNLSNAVTLTQMFKECASLTSIPEIDTHNCTDFSYMFSWCTSLRSVPWFDSSLGTSFTGMFYECSVLGTVPPFNTSAGGSFENMFYDCYQLKYVPLFDMSAGSSVSGMFMGCWALTNVPAFNTSTVQIFSNMFFGCYNLEVIPAIDLSYASDLTNIFQSANGICRVLATGFQNSFNVAWACLSRSAIVELFTALPTVSGKTIDVSGNPGASSLTAADRAIATAKGWTVTV